MPVLVFRIKGLFEEKDKGKKLDLTIPEEKRTDFFDGLIEAIYKKYIEIKLAGLPTSLTTVVRDKTFYDYGSETYIAYKRTYKLEENNFIYLNHHIIK